jgi:hypothetical protein
MPGNSGSKGRGAAIRDKKLKLWRDQSGGAVDIRKAAGKMSERERARRTTAPGKARSR